MVKIAPFRGLHYNFKKIHDLSRVVVPPYDIISERGRDYFLEMHPYNFVRLVRGERRLGDHEFDNSYTRAQAHFQIWIKEEVLIQDTSPALYYYRQEFTLSRRKLVRDGLIAAVKLDEEMILPHEKIMPEPSQDRFNLMTHCPANFSPIFTAYSDPSFGVRNITAKMTARTAFIDVMDNLRVRHLLWRVGDSSTIEQIRHHLNSLPLYIVDGHHRYAAALRYRDLMREKRGRDEKAPSEYMMMYLCPLEDEGLKVFPIHRAISGMKNFSEDDFFIKMRDYFEIESTADINEFYAKMQQLGRGVPSFGFKLVADLKFYIARLKDMSHIEKFCEGHALCYKKSSAVALHQIVLKTVLGITEEQARAEKGVNYIKGLDRDIKAALLKVSKGTLQGLFFLPKPEVTDIVEFAQARETMPPKSTYFYPKVIGGLVLRNLAQP